MGFYIQTSGNKGKANFLVENHGAKIITPPAKFDEIPAHLGLICVVDNVMFEAAGYCFSEYEFIAFTDSFDIRPKTWLVMDKILAEKLSGYKR